MDAESRKSQPEDIDRWIDLALRARADAEPRIGLEDRVLARLAAEPPDKTARWPVLAAVAAVLLFAAALAIMYVRHQQPIIASGRQPKPSEGPRVLAKDVPPDNGRAKRHYHSQATHTGAAACCLSRKIPAGSSPDESVRRPLRRQPAVRIQHDPWPKLARFPTPRPETAEERMLARLAARRGSYDMTNLSTGLRPMEVVLVPEFKTRPMEEASTDNTPQE